MSESTEYLEKAKELLDTMLGYLGFVVEIEMQPENHCLQVHTKEGAALIGRRGERLEDMQYLVNRLLCQSHPNAPKVRVDVDHFRSMREDQMIQQIQRLADSVRKTGKPVRLDPMNSYERLLVHNAFKDDPIIQTWSPPDAGRVKRITLMRRSNKAR